MERGSHFGTNLSHSFSMPSLAEGSEPISEAEELLEVKTLKERGDEAMHIHDYGEAIKLYNEALEIDDKNVDVLMARTAAYLEEGDFIKALRDTEQMILIEADNPEIYKLQGITLFHMQQNRESINALLTALDLDPDNAEDITDHIAAVVGNICNLSIDLAETLLDMDAYKKLSEVGVCLFQAKKYDICVKVLESAQKFQTNQKGITMRVLLTMANAHSAMKHSEQAISLYQECLSTAIATHEQIYQTKALVNIATLYLESGDLHQAIVYYEKLLHLESELIEEFGTEDHVPDFWTRELQCGLHLNLSIAYKSIGNMHSAVVHARQYTNLLDKYNLTGKIIGESYHNAGMLNEILGNYREALKNYEMYLKTSKEAGDKKGVAQAYGCLGSVYAALRNWKLSVTYHDQYISIADKSNDTRMMMISREMLADTYMLKGDSEAAVLQYEAMYKTCIRTDYRGKATALCKIGNAFRDLKRNQYSIHYYEQAYDLAQDYLFSDIQTLCEFNIACIKQQSTQMMDIELARKYFSKLIPFLEMKIREHLDEDTHCPSEYHQQLVKCYDGMQCVLAKLGNKDECLQFAEMYRRRHLTQQAGYLGSLSSGLTGYSHGSVLEVWTLDRINRVVSQQSAYILYYSLINSHLLLWVIAPGQGIVRFYSRKADDDMDMVEQVKDTLDELRTYTDHKSLQNSCENRCLPPKDLELELVRKKNMMLGKSDGKSQKSDEDKSVDIPLKTPARRLFDLLLAPVEDILIKLESKSPLIIVPDKYLHHCPFGILQDWYSRYLYDRFRITYLPSLLALEKVVHNELNHLRAKDDLEFERTQARKGGLSKVLSLMLPSASTTPGENSSVLSSEAIFDLKKVSNPRLVTSNMSRTKTPVRDNTKLTDEVSKKTTRQSTQILPGISEFSGTDTASLQHIPVVSLSQQVAAPPAVGNPVLPDKMLNIHNYSTLTTRTSTGTDITTSSQCVTQFEQVSSHDRCMVIGNPQLPEKLLLHGREWRPSLLDLDWAHQECKTVASYLDVDAITGPEATKARFLQDAPKATVLHIATYGCFKEGLLVLSPSPVQLVEGPPKEPSYLVTVEDILDLKLSAELVTLNVGYSPYRLKETINPGYELASAFLAAGAECVLLYAWPLPNETVNKFYFHFYANLQTGSFLTTATTAALQAVKEDNRFSETYFWCPFILVGKDVMVNLKDIRHSQLDQTLDRTEKSVEEELGKEILNPKSSLPKVPVREEHLLTLQSLLGTVLYHHSKQPNVVPELIDLLDSSLKRLHTEELNQQTTNLSKHLTGSIGGLDLLKCLGFHFQAKGSTLADPYVVYPHWNRDELLVPTYDALRAVSEITRDTTCTERIHNMLPLSQDTISLIIDLMSITKHAPEIQLKVNDLSVRPLWQNPPVKKTLNAIGFHQIGLLLNFNRTPQNKTLLTAVLQLFLAMSAYKSQVLLYRLDVNLLGKPGTTKVIKPTMLQEVGRLPSLTPLLLPRNQLRMSTPWLSRAEKADEMDEKIKLARGKSDLDERYTEYQERARTWHQITVVAQSESVKANEALSKFGRPRTTPTKVKVMAGASASRDRIPVEREHLMGIPEVDQRRDYAQYVLQQRLSNIDLRHRNDVMKLYLPYIQST
ncbi:tetratricopeptide repeat protein 28-like [Ylistrum balloti]|uniref:tetratricopeptide repeat protein 28-like n=1 Tax=Ylistrum balloti TaxID=509963 RepID=UPI002905E249|nr:tetratricopeptide repeat protein 28-like [Ylistrum balloti]